MIKPHTIVKAKDLEKELTVSEGKSKIMISSARKFYNIQPRMAITFGQVLKANNLEVNTIPNKLN